MGSEAALARRRGESGFVSGWRAGSATHALGHGGLGIGQRGLDVLVLLEHVLELGVDHLRGHRVELVDRHRREEQNSIIEKTKLYLNKTNLILKCVFKLYLLN